MLVTGHTGFKGGWLVTWLTQLGVEVHGYALDPDSEQGFFNCARVAELLASDNRGDVADLNLLHQVLEQTRPEIIFHLAAQPLVRVAYENPQLTWQTNLMGTVNVLETARMSTTVAAVVVVTSDKVYRPRSDGKPSDEGDQLGAPDPYSASKAGAELVAESYQKTYPVNSSERALRVATARSGNVIGGGDRSWGRLLPDCIRSMTVGRPIELRSPEAVRPWQHVLDPLAGYLLLAERLLSSDGDEFSSSWNFGPKSQHSVSVRELVAIARRSWGSSVEVVVEPDSGWPAETELLRLDSSKSQELLGWHPKWDVKQAVDATVAWHQAHLEGQSMDVFCRMQLQQYLNEENGGTAP